MDLIEFLCENSKIAVGKSEKFQKKETNLNVKIRQCVDEFKLIVLSHENGFAHEELMDCLQNLLVADDSLKAMLKDQQLHIGRSYGVLPDGRIVIPVDFAPRNSN